MIWMNLYDYSPVHGALKSFGEPTAGVLNFPAANMKTKILICEIFLPKVVKVFLTGFMNNLLKRNVKN